MAKESIFHKGWRIDVMPHGGGWKAFIYRPGATLDEGFVPNGKDRDAVIQEAKDYIDRN